VIFDTDVLNYAQRGSTGAANVIDRVDERYVSVQTIMELLQGARARPICEQSNGFWRNYVLQLCPSLRG